MNRDINIQQLVCRTCLNMHRNFSNIFDHFKNDKSVSEILAECIAVEVQRDDGLPINICSVCLEKLGLFYDFKTMVIDSDRKLHDSYNSDSPYNFNIKMEVEDVKCDMLGDCVTDNIQDEIQPLLHPVQMIILKNNAGNNKITEKNLNCEEYEIVDNLSMDLKHSNFDVPNNLDDNNQVENSDNLLPKVTSMSKNTNAEMPIDDDTAFKLDTSEYDHLKKTLSKAEKYKTRVFCKICKRTYRFFYYPVHLRMHRGQRQYKCEICDRRYLEVYTLNEHMKVHNEKIRHTCEICGKSYKMASGLYVHKRYSHNENRLFKCTLCEKTFKHPTSFRNHMNVHTNEKLYVCEVCGKSYSDRSSLKSHIVMHDTEFKYNCEVCGKLFRTKRSHRVHLKTHSDVRPYVCGVCNKSFKFKPILEHHILIHTGDKPYLCKICDRKFRQPSSLRSHMKIHTGEAPFACELCPSTFKLGHHLRGHIKVHHQEQK